MKRWIDRLVGSIIGLQHRMELGIDWSSQLANELHKSDLINVLYLLDKSMIYGLQI